MSRARGDEKDEEELLRLIDSVSPGSSSFQPRPRAAAPVGETTGSGGLRLLTEEANRQGGGSNRESIGYGRPDMTPGTAGDDSEEANQMEVFKEFLSKDAARKLQGMIVGKHFYRSDQPKTADGRPPVGLTGTGPRVVRLSPTQRKSH